ncbi:hypothetical protein I3271_05300 [Photobacterium leiognathi]|uniref:hypothetical protein n=1 Tax=Photobacterium leiognathi TaxID=553611 RepID=UPI001EE09015|nr:hypothetical protein [Photobacterium leiognathi]MCG3884096.1 hypothetical protein [Photobacterium leiognathi]
MICGVPADDGISDSLKVHITFQDDGEQEQDISIVGYLVEGSSVSLSNSYIEPFSGDTIDSIDRIEEKFKKLITMTKAATDVTFNTVLNSVSVWEGTNPITFSLVLYFHAYNDAKREVMEPIRQLLRAALPELSEVVPFPTSGGEDWGRVPKTCMVDIGRKIKVPLCIDDVQYEIDAPKTRDGDFAYNTVTLNCTMKQVMQRSSVTEHFV